VLVAIGARQPNHGFRINFPVALGFVGPARDAAAVADGMASETPAALLAAAWDGAGDRTDRAC
jgi:hypothetical protein